MRKQRAILNRQERESHKLNGARLIAKWTVSRGRDTYGYNICSLYVNGVKQHSCCGGGYDMTGTVIGNFIQSNFPEQIKKLRSDKFYGLTFSKVYKNRSYRRFKRYSEGMKFYVDGACGSSSMEDILRKIGFRLEYIHGSTNETIYKLRAI